MSLGSQRLFTNDTDPKTRLRGLAVTADSSTAKHNIQITYLGLRGFCFKYFP